MGSSGARAQALQNELDTVHRDIIQIGVKIINVGKRIVSLLGNEEEGASDLIAELKTLQADMIAEQTYVEIEQTELELLLAPLLDKRAGRRRAGDPPLKRLYLVSAGHAGDKADFVKEVLMKRPLDFSRSGVIQLGGLLWGQNGDHDFLINCRFEIGRELALDFIQNRESIIVAGSAGIGKSCLGLVIVGTLLENDKIVAYELGDTRMLLVPSKAALDVFKTCRDVIDWFDENGFEMVGAVGIYKLNADEAPLLFNDLRTSVNLVHVLDAGGMQPGVAESGHCQIVITSSNSLARFGCVGLDAKHVIYPPWTWDQILEMNSALGDGHRNYQEGKILKLKFDLFGGIPRHIFVNETMGKAMRFFERAVNDVPIEIWKDAFCSINYADIPPQLPGLFVAITKSDILGKKCDVMFSTEYIAQRVIRHFVHSQRHELMTALNAMDGPPQMMSAMQGYLLEEVMHDALLSLKPVKYQLMDLEAQGPPVRPREVQFPKLCERTFSRMDMSDIEEKMEENVYFRPIIPNFGSVESFAIVEKSVLCEDERGHCIVAFQATLSDDHPLQRSGLEAIQNKVAVLHGRILDMYVVFVTNKGKGISKRQKLGQVEQTLDANYRQCVLYEMKLDDVVMKSTML